MSKIEELINKLCPDGVEVVKLNDIFDIKNGYTPSTKEKTF
ncbi:restriction endonuclease subunit S [bacterium]|nr:restriction endonuclease subunit S [bacterium]